MKKIVEMLLGLFKPFIKDALKALVKDALEKVRAKNVENYKTIVTSLYPPVDVQLQDLVENTTTEFDDALVLGIKEAIEESATLHGVTLPNLDAD